MEQHYGIINGPNLNLLGTREPGLYGSQTFEDYLSQLRSSFPGIRIDYFQSNSEGDLIDCLQNWGYQCQGLILNAGGYSHSSIALADAVRAIKTPVVEVHISNIYAREAYRHHSYISTVARAIIAGMGLEGYRLALEYLLTLPSGKELAQ